ncbi:MAG: hypothetical protein MUE77_11700 [Sandarakinorhabdus sp.]|jgi:hypothetical protein|nr:hypothetical protein [Sandarakinorhabdus sp.]
MALPGVWSGRAMIGLKNPESHMIRNKWKNSPTGVIREKPPQTGNE